MHASNIVERSFCSEIKVPSFDMAEDFPRSDQKEHKMVQHSSTTLAQSHTAHVLACALAIFALYSVFGILQEKITRTKYGSKGEQFQFTFVLVLVQCLANTIFAQIVIMLSPSSHPSGKKADKSHHPEHKVLLNPVPAKIANAPIMHLYLACAMSYMSAMLASNYSLQFVSYPTQVLAKSCKPIPVMLFGVLLAHKRYPPLKYLFVFLITIGVAIFMYNPRKAAKYAANHESHAAGFGEFLLFFSLALDGLTGVFQERIRRHNVKSHHLMLWVNIFSTIALTVLVFVSGEIFTFIPFVQRHPHVVVEMLLFALCSALGQYFIFIAVVEFGPLMLAIITTTRKFFSVLFSVVMFGNEMLPHQWLATALVFAGLLADSIYNKRTPAPHLPVGIAANRVAAADSTAARKKNDDETEPLLTSGVEFNDNISFSHGDDNDTAVNGAACRRRPFPAGKEPAASFGDSSAATLSRKDIFTGTVGDSGDKVDRLHGSEVFKAKEL